MKLLISVFLLILPILGQAQAASTPAQAALGWTAPTKYVEDNSNLPASDIAGYAVFYGPQSRFTSGTTLRAGCAAKPANQTDTSCYATAAFSTGSATAFTVTTTITQSGPLFLAVAAKATNGNVSAYSNETSKQFTVTTTGLTPGVPTTITLTITLGACMTNVPGTSCSVTVQ